MALATGSPLSSVRSALSPEVPQSSPRYMGAHCALRPAALTSGRAITRASPAPLGLILSVPQSLAAGRGRRRCEPSPLGVGVVSVQPYAAFENVPQPGKDRLISAAGRFVDPFPIVCARLAGESANEASGEYAARQVSGRRVMRKASGEVASDRVDRRARDMRVRAGPDESRGRSLAASSVGLAVRIL